jgi:hypothetical protein
MITVMVRAALIVLALLVGAAPAAAHDDWWSRWHHPPGQSKDKDKDKPSTTAPATTAVPGTTAAPASTAAPADVAQVPAPAAPAAPTPSPQLGATVALAAVSGTVAVRAPGGATVDLTSATELPTGTRIDTRAGEVALTTAIDTSGATQTGRFSGGVFEVRQSKTAKGMTGIVLVGGHWADCKTGRYVTRAAARKKVRKPIRKLWGSDDHGRFQTRGGGSVATVRGTRWLTTDTCDGTRTTVLEGAVSVKSRRTGKTRLVTARHTLFVKR